MRAPQDRDVAIVGAGPAGSALARRLALQGCRVALIERSRFDAPRIGESLAPGIKPALQAIDAWDAFLALGPLPSWGVSAHWGAGDGPQTHSHIFSAHGCGWHVDRRRFDRMLAQRAVDAGAELRVGAAVRDVQAVGDDWRLAVKTDDGATASLCARVVVDATGRRALLGRKLGATRIAFDRLVGVAAHLRLPDRDARQHLRVEAIASGWWYFAPLPEGAAAEPDAILAMLMTDADLCADARLQRPGPWLAHLRESAFGRALVRANEAIPTLRTHCAGSHRMRRDPASMQASMHARWLAVGDAALAVDPISGSGVPRALRSAKAAAATVLAMLRGETSVAAHERERDVECTRYLFERAAYYADEDRWPEATFWRRRAPAPEAPASTRAA